MLSDMDFKLMSDDERRFLVRDNSWRDKLIDDQMLNVRVRLQPSLLRSRNPMPSIGTLNNLPLETLYTIFDDLSVADILSLLLTNSKSHVLVSAWPSFALVINYGSNAIRAVIGFGAAHLFIFAEVKRVVLSDRCEICREHGEILYVPKLIRCCFHCLSTERSLLAVNAGYAVNDLKIPKAIIAKMPIFHTIPQLRHCGFELGRMPMVDYTTAIEFATPETEPQLEIDDKRQIFVQARTLPAAMSLPAVWVSSPRRRRQELQIRRQQSSKSLPLLSIPSAVVRPHEGFSGQHACSIYLPAIKRASAPYPQFEIQHAKHCGGCAHYWNYHSALPLEYHTMYRGSLSDPSSELAIHIAHCIYARMWHSKICDMPNPGYALQIHRLHRLRVNRWGSANPEANAHAFEMFSVSGAATINKAKADEFTQPTWWPAGHPEADEEEGVADEDMVVPTVEMRKRDGFGDMLFGSEAISQASWATARVFGNTDIFHGPLNLVFAKRARERVLIVKQHKAGLPMRGLWQGQMEFDLFG